MASAPRLSQPEPATPLAMVADTPPLLITIEAGRRGFCFAALREIWEHRELVAVLAARDLKVRYKQTVLGAAWAIIQPLLTTIIFTILFGRIAKFPSDGIPYPIFAYAGLLPWTFFSTAVTSGSNSVVNNAGLITKVYFPRAVIPLAAVIVGLADFAIASTLMLAMMAWYRIVPGAGIAMLPVLIAMLLSAALGVGMWLSALHVRYRDTRHAVPFAMQLWLYLSPIIYPVTFMPPRWRWVLALNPLTGTLEGFRSALFGKPFAWNALAASAAVTLIVLASGQWFFARMEREFADVI